MDSCTYGSSYLILSVIGNIIGDAKVDEYPGITFTVEFNSIKFKFTTGKKNYDFANFACMCITNTPYILHCESDLGPVVFEVVDEFILSIRIGKPNPRNNGRAPIELAGDSEVLGHAFANAKRTQNDWTEHRQKLRLI